MVTETTFLTKIFTTSTILVFTAVTSYLQISPESLGLLFTLIVLDMISGSMASLVKKTEFTLARFYSGIFTKFILIILPVALAMVIKISGQDLVMIVNWTILTLAVSEFISIMNNLLRIQGKKQLAEFDAITAITRKLRNILIKLFDNNTPRNYKDRREDIRTNTDIQKDKHGSE